MTTYYVATLARYVLVDAPNENEAQRLATPLLEELHAEVGEQIGRKIPVQIRTVRPATEDEIEFCKEHEEMLRRYGLTEDPAPDASDWV